MTEKMQKGLYANIHAKQDRIAHGSGEKMREPGEPGAPTAEAFDKAAKSKDKDKDKDTGKGKARGGASSK
jgi:hypothetical protein